MTPSWPEASSAISTGSRTAITSNGSGNATRPPLQPPPAARGGRCYDGKTPEARLAFPVGPHPNNRVHPCGLETSTGTEGKLVRDLIPDIIEKSGRSADVRYLSGNDREVALTAKLLVVEHPGWATDHPFLEWVEGAAQDVLNACGQGASLRRRPAQRTRADHQRVHGGPEGSGLLSTVSSSGASDVAIQEVDLVSDDLVEVRVQVRLEVGAVIGAHSPLGMRATIFWAFA